jgi:hypothetical protein
MRNQCNHLMTRRTALAALFGGTAAAASGCMHGFFGYTTTPNYDPEIRTVYLPVFKAAVLETNPFRGMEMTLTRKVADAIESKTPMKVLSDPNGADTELQGTILAVSKLLTNVTPFNEAREIALYLTCEIVWYDHRPGHEGKILTNPRNKDGTVPPIAGGFQFDPANAPPPPKPDKPRPQQISANGRALPELGETVTTALDMAMNRLAVKIVSAMEQPW